jgi:hypothetical protein
MVNPLIDWATRWGISAEAIADLQQNVIPHISDDIDSGSSEGTVQANIRLEASKLSWWVMRNNVGVLTNKKGRPVRYGLMNSSSLVNSQYKSSDLIGLRQVLITPAMVGHTLAQFVAIECKRADWKPGEDVARETAQQNFINAVNSRGGLAFFCCNPSDLRYY